MNKERQALLTTQLTKAIEHGIIRKVKVKKTERSAVDLHCTVTYIFF